MTRWYRVPGLCLISACLLGACATEEMAAVLPVQTPNVATAPPAAPIPDPRDAEIARLQAEVGLLRARLQALSETVSQMTDERQKEEDAKRLAAVPVPAPPPAPPKAAPPAKAPPRPGPKSILPATPPAEAAVKPVAGGTFGIHLASYRSREIAAEGWRNLQQNFPAKLEAFTSRVTPLVMGGKKGTYYRLIAGPLGTAEDAARLCAQLRKNDVFCEPAAFAGDPLPPAPELADILVEMGKTP